MADDSGQVTLIFYKLDHRWWKEPFLNIVAAAAQMSSFTHVELAIGSDAGDNGAMANVCRVFNDSVGCVSFFIALNPPTGRSDLPNPHVFARHRLLAGVDGAHRKKSTVSPLRLTSHAGATALRDIVVTWFSLARRYSYLQLGCSKSQELAMLRYASSCVGKPFSGTAMARSLVCPRQTDGSSFFCAELVAAVLKEGGLLDSVSNPGAATPESLHALYKARATTTANPFLLRQANCQRNLTTNSIVQERIYTPPPLHHRTSAVQPQPQPQPHAIPPTALYTACRAGPISSAASRGEYAPFSGTVRASNGRTTALRVLHEGSRSAATCAPQQLGLTLNSLNFRSGGR